MAKTNKPNTKLPSLANPCGVEERLRRLCETDDNRAIPITEKFIEDISLEIITWADLPDSFLLKDFYNPRGYSDDKLERWAAKYPVFKAALDYAKHVIGARRERKKIVEENCTFTLSIVNKDWREQEDKLHQRKLEIAAKKDQNQPTVVKIVQMKAEDCPEVPFAPAEKVTDDDRS